MGYESFQSLVADNRPRGELALTAYLEAPDPQPTYIDKLDQLLGGGVMRGVTVIGGPSSSGKSIIGSQSAAMMATRGVRVVYASYEMPWDVVQLRMASAWSCTQSAREMGVEPFSWSEVATGKARASRPLYRGLSHEQRSRLIYEDHNDPIIRALTMWDEGPGRNVAVVTSNVSVGALCSTCEQIGDGTRPVIICDYIQIMPTGRDDQKEYERVTEVMNTLQAHSLSENGAPVIAISSCRNLRQQDYADGPSMDWLRGSGYIQYDAEQVVMLTPDRERSEETGEWGVRRNERGNVEAKLTVLKNRTGATGRSIAVEVFGGYNTIQ